MRYNTILFLTGREQPMECQLAWYNTYVTCLLKLLLTGSFSPCLTMWKVMKKALWNMIQLIANWAHLNLWKDVRCILELKTMLAFLWQRHPNAALWDVQLKKLEVTPTLLWIKRQLNVGCHKECRHISIPCYFFNFWWTRKVGKSFGNHLNFLRSFIQREFSCI